MRYLLPIVAWLLYSSVQATEQTVCTKPGTTTCTCVYDTSSVCKLVAYVGYQLVITLPPGERVNPKSYFSGNTSVWEYVVDQDGSNVFAFKYRNREGIVLPNSDSNASVVSTSGKVYKFFLTLNATRIDRPNTPLWVTVVHPSEGDSSVPQGGKPTLQRQGEIGYKYRGYKPLYPNEVFDDGKFTYLRFLPNQKPLPIIVVKEDIGSGEDEYNVRYECFGHECTVYRLAPLLVLRRGNHVVEVLRERPL